MYDILMQLPVFQGVSTDQMTYILEKTPFDFRNYQKGSIIVQSGELCDGAIFLLSGSVQLQTPSFNNRIMIHQEFSAPYTFSLHHLFGADMTSHSTIVANEDRTGIMMLKKRDFLRVLMDNEITLINSMNMLCTMAQKQHKAIDFSGQTDPVLRLASWLLVFTERAAHQVCAIAELDDWCDLLQLDISSFWRCVATLEGLHLVELEKGQLKLLDRYGLKSLVNKKTSQNV